MRAQAGSIRIGDDERFAEWMPIGLRGGQLGWLTCPGQGQAGDNCRCLRARQSGLVEALACRLQYRAEAPFQTEPKICRAARRLAESARESA